MIETERKFLVRRRDWGPPRSALALRQGYLMTAAGRSLRIRQKGDSFLLTFKADRDGASRYEFEYEVPADDGRALLALCDRAPIEKERLEVAHGDHVWEIDVFCGANAGLVIAEVELDGPHDTPLLPAWLGPEVTHDKRFTNAALYEAPFETWGVSYEALLTKAG